MGELAALIAAFTWSVTSVALTSLSVRTSPVALSALRLGSATLALPLVLWVSGQGGELGDARLTTILAVAGSGLVGYGLGDTVYILALSRVGMQRTFTVTMALFIALTVAGGVAWLGEPFSWGLVMGAGLIAVGMALLLQGEGPATAPRTDVAASRLASPGRGTAGVVEAAVLLGLVGILWACATLWLAAGRGDLGPIAAGTLRTAAGAAGMMGFGLATRPGHIRAPFREGKHIGGIVAAGLTGTLFGSMLYVYAVVEAGAARAAVLSASSPLMALPLGVLLLGETVTRRTVAGTASCVLGILLVVLV